MRQYGGIARVPNEALFGHARYAMTKVTIVNADLQTQFAPSICSNNPTFKEY